MVLCIDVAQVPEDEDDRPYSSMSDGMHGLAVLIVRAIQLTLHSSPVTDTWTITQGDQYAGYTVKSTDTLWRVFHIF